MAEQQNLTESLNRLEAWLSTRSDAALKPGLTRPEFIAQTACLPFEPPPELAELYAWHDGQAYGEPFFDYFSFYSLADALAQYAELRQVSLQLESEHGFTSWPASRLPIFGFEGEYFAMDCQTGVVWFMFIQDDPRYWFDSLSSFLAYLAQACSLGLYDDTPDGLALHQLRLSLVSAPADLNPLHAL